MMLNIKDAGVSEITSSGLTRKSSWAQSQIHNFRKVESFSSLSIFL